VGEIVAARPAGEVAVAVAGEVAVGDLMAEGVGGTVKDGLGEAITDRAGEAVGDGLGAPSGEWLGEPDAEGLGTRVFPWLGMADSVGRIRAGPAGGDAGAGADAGRCVIPATTPNTATAAQAPPAIATARRRRRSRMPCVMIAEMSTVSSPSTGTRSARRRVSRVSRSVMTGHFRSRGLVLPDQR
jgi:hypothetical protein